MINFNVSLTICIGIGETLDVTVSIYLCLGIDEIISFAVLLAFCFGIYEIFDIIFFSLTVTESLTLSLDYFL